LLHPKLLEIKLKTLIVISHRLGFIKINVERILDV